MHDDHTGTPAGVAAPEAEEQARAEPRRAETDSAPGVERPERHPDPTRYGDWEKDGRCIDF